MSAVLPVDEETWTKTASGLSYIDEMVGSGETPPSGAIVKVAYTGWLESTGKEFDSGSIAFAVGTGRVIPGWDEGISTMNVGGKRRLSVPSDLAYGETGAGEAIPPNSQLQFECELISVETGINGFVATFPGGLPNLALVTLLALSFIPYFLPPELQPSGYQ